MSWTTPITWQSQLVTVAQFNEQIRDNLNALKNPPSAHSEADEAANYSNSVSGSWSDVDAAEGKFQHTIVTAGGDVLVGFIGAVHGSASVYAKWNILVDGTARVAADDGIASVGVGALSDGLSLISFVYLIAGLSPGSHSFRLQWQPSSGTITLSAGAGSSQRDVHPQFWVREVS